MVSRHTVLCCAYSFSRVQLFVTPWTVAHQATLSMEILQVRILEWVAMPSSRGSSQPRDSTQVSCIAGGFFFFFFFTAEPLGKPNRKGRAEQILKVQQLFSDPLEKWCRQFCSLKNYPSKVQNMEQRTDSNLRKECDNVVCCHLIYLT